jgi:hypothetical protein
MFGAGVEVFAVWGYVIANTVDSTIELNSIMLSAILGSSPDKIEAAIDFLCAPDPKSRNGDHQGRRLIKQGPYQFHVVTHQHYRAIRNEDDRREYNRRKMAESRARRKTVMSNGQSPSIKVNHSVQSVPPCTHTEAEAYTDTKTEEQKPSPKPRKRASEGAKKRESSPRHKSLKAVIESYWNSKNTIPMPWDGSEGAQLGMWESANPTVTAEQFTGFLRNRFKSEVNHSERPSKWIRNVTSYANGPLNQFNKPLTNGGSNGKGKGDANLAACREALERINNGPDPDGDDEGHDGGRFDFRALLPPPRA